MDRGSWQATVHGFAKNRTRLIVLYFDFCGVWRYAVLCLVGQSSPTLCDPINCSWSGSSVHDKNTGVGCVGAFQSAEWAVVKRLTDTDPVVDQALNDQQSRK